ncbi:efflux RND transporter periplasmic adaptor subunit [Brevibacillus centrosporus]|uniref:efflux RND transporter periplasmic adaptor subunit n=1 Tax=Brevibacillus centrosporus TaxID=54910 RepID=UPI002E20F02F|nr:efflux RND transporter periplasmic adaptor subunit [Brevibacillus centrosporus]MED1950931.1 efflux RND transporter periplasmic adaptor subunit [Brevibacillus centrosporus]
MKKRASIMLASLLLVATGCGPAPEAPQQAEVKAKVVEVIKVQKAAKPVMLSVTGMVEAKREAVLPFGTGGTISAIQVSKGARIGQGQLLATLDTRYYQKEVEVAASQVAEAAARKTQTLKGATTQAIEQQRLQVKSAQSQLDKARQDVTVGDKLLAGGAISQSEINDRKRALTQAEIAVRDAQLALDELLRGAEPEDVAVANASIKQASGQVDRAKKTLEDAKIEAPFAGTIVEVFKQSGEQASPGEQIIHLVDLSEVKVTLDITNDSIGQFQEKAKVQIVSDDGKKSEGTVTFVSPVVDKQTGKYRVEVTVPNPDNYWRGGMTATVEVPRKINGFLVPLESVGVSQSQHYVMAVENGLTVRKEVKVGQMTGDQVEILSGIKEGDQLLRTGITFYVEGQKVEARGE